MSGLYPPLVFENIHMSSPIIHKRSQLSTFHYTIFPTPTDSIFNLFPGHLSMTHTHLALPMATIASPPLLLGTILWPWTIPSLAHNGVVMGRHRPSRLHHRAGSDGRRWSLCILVLTGNWLRWLLEEWYLFRGAIKRKENMHENTLRCRSMIRIDFGNFSFFP